MFRHQQRGPGRGEQDAHHHDEGVDGADAAPEQQVTTPATHSPPLSLSLSHNSVISAGTSWAEGHVPPQDVPDGLTLRKQSSCNCGAVSAVLYTVHPVQQEMREEVRTYPYTQMRTWTSFTVITDNVF